MGIHVRAQNGVNPRLVAALPPEPLKQVRIHPHGHHRFPAGPYDLGILPEFFIGGMGVGVRRNALAYLSIAHAAQAIPARASALSSVRRFASRSAFRSVPPAMRR